MLTIHLSTELWSSGVSFENLASGVLERMRLQKVKSVMVCWDGKEINETCVTL